MIGNTAGGSTILHLLSTIKQEAQRDDLHLDVETTTGNSAAKKGNSTVCTGMRTVNVSMDSVILVTKWAGFTIKGKRSTRTLSLVHWRIGVMELVAASFMSLLMSLVNERLGDARRPDNRVTASICRLDPVRTLKGALPTTRAAITDKRTRKFLPFATR